MSRGAGAGGGAAGGGGPGGVGGVRRRPATVVIRDGGGDAVGVREMMDPAARSLADALRIIYRLLQVGMVCLAILFVFSGAQSVDAGERGLRISMGRIEADDLSPGFQLTFPAPLGELVKVPTGPENLRMDREFFPSLREEDRVKPLDQLKNMGKGSLDPASDGSLITGDGNLAHARVNVTFRRENVREVATNLNDADAARLVRSAVQRGLVHGAARLTIDEFTKGVAGEGRAERFFDLAARARAIAQQTLTQMQTGLVIDDLSLSDRTPPLSTIAAFDKVSQEESRAAKAIEEARGQRIRRLGEAAGDAAGPMLAAIDAYERALAAADAEPANAARRAEAEAVLARIDAMLEGTVAGAAGPAGEGGAVRIGGEAASRLNAAREYRSSVVSRAQADAALFATKLEAYRQNPSVVVTGGWTDAFAAFMSQPNVEMIVLPPGVRTLTLLINRDQDLLRQGEEERTKREAEARTRREIEEADRARFQDADKGRTLRAD